MSIRDDQSMIVSEGDLGSVSEVSINEDILEDVLDDVLRETEVGMNADFPNEAYADLMGLVTKHNLSSSAGNAIIKFFNKYANLSTSPLPKSIDQGRKYMDNMNLPTLTFTKTVIKYNNKEYYLHHRSLINCITNILSIPDISQDFALNFKRLKVITVNATVQLIQLCMYLQILLLKLCNYSVTERGHIVNKIPDYGGKVLKKPYHLVPSFYL